MLFREHAQLVSMGIMKTTSTAGTLIVGLGVVPIVPVRVTV